MVYGLLALWIFGTIIFKTQQDRHGWTTVLIFSTGLLILYKVS